MTNKSKTIILIVLIGAVIVGFVTFNVIKLVDMFSDDEKNTHTSDIAFTLTDSEQDKKHLPENPTALSDRDLLLSKQKPYVQGQQQLENEQNSKNQPTVSFSSIFSQQEKESETRKGSKSTNFRRSNNDEISDWLLPSAEDIKPDLTGKRGRKPPRQSSADKAYADLENDIQTFYNKDNKTTRTRKETEPQEAPISDIERRRRALQNGFDINQAQKQSNNNAIIVAVRGNQEVSSGQSVKLRVLDACRYNNIDIPRNTILDGRVSVSGSNRLSISVNAIQVNQQTFSVELRAYDMYGQTGLPLTVDKGKSIGTEEVSDAVENVARQTIGRTTIGKIVTGSFGELRKDGKKTIIILDAQKLILK